MDNIAERFGVGSGSVRFEGSTLSWKGVWWHKAVESLIALGISQKIINELTYRAMRDLSLIFTLSAEEHIEWVAYN